MFSVYLLSHQQTGEIYYGYTNDLDRRRKEHQREGPWRPVYYEAYVSEVDARAREEA